MAYSALTKERREEYEDLGFDEAKIVNIEEKARKELGRKQEMLCLSTRGPIQGDRKVLRLLMLGKTGAGKSATGNLILGRHTFREEMRSESCTETIQLGTTTIDDIEVQMIDTPGFFDTNAPPEQAITEIAKVVEVYKEGIDGILFVYSMGNPRFTAEEKAAFDSIEQGTISLGFVNNCFVIITHGDMMVSRQSLTEYMQQELDSPFGKLLNETVKRRVIVVDNAERTEYGRALQGEQVVRMVAAETSGPCAPAVFQQFLQSRRELIERTPERFHHLVPEIEQKVAEGLSGMPHDRIAVMSQDQDQIRRIVAVIMSELPGSKTPKSAAEKDTDLADVVTDVVGTVIVRLTKMEFLKPVAAFAVPLLKAALGVTIKVGTAVLSGLTKLGGGILDFFSK